MNSKWVESYKVAAKEIERNLLETQRKKDMLYKVGYWVVGIFFIAEVILGIYSYMYINNLIKLLQ
jgi:hypothetical protein